MLRRPAVGRGRSSARGLFRSRRGRRSWSPTTRPTAIDGTDALLALHQSRDLGRIYLDGRAPDDVAAELKSYAGMKILYVCHRFPFPPKRGGKIRPFNMIRHLHAQGHEVTVCSLARSDDEATEGEGIAPHCAALRDGAGDAIRCRWLRMVARLPTPTPSSMGFFYSPELARTHPARCCASERFDLIFVHCSSVAQYVEHVRGIPKILDFGDMDSQKWLEYARYKPFPLSLGYRLEGSKMLARGKAAGAPLRPVHGHHARRVGDARRLRHRRRHRLVSQRRRRRVLRARRTSPTTPTPSASSAAWTTTRTRSACPTSARNTLPLLRAQRPQHEAADRRRRPVAGDAQAGRAARRHGDRLGARRAAVHARARR